MNLNILQRIFGSSNDRLLKQYGKIVNKINLLEAGTAELSDDQLAARTGEYKARYEEGESLEKLIPEAFATVREASKRVLGMRHFDVQLVGGLVLNDGIISEMRTGEGKTVVATLAAYLNALSGKGVHVVTVNDYLAQRDSEWMGRLYNFLGLTTGVIVSGMDQADKKQAYAADITYGTNNEFGFDYLRDNMAFTLEDKVQRVLNFAIVDEVDSILIDEARTPLIISGAVDDNSELYEKFTSLVKKLVKGESEDDEDCDFTIDEKHRSVHITETGHEHVENILTEAGILPGNESLYSAANVNLVHYLNAALRAENMFQKDVHYIVQDDEVVIVDEFTGRTMPGRRWSDGLHQSVEAKEGVPIQNENQTLASITFQNYFRLYTKLSGMTGTADTEAPEFHQIYGLNVAVIPTNMEMIRDDKGDLVYLSAKEKYEAVIEDIEDCYQRKQPVLVGTASIEVSELIAKMLDNTKIPYNVLNAKQHKREASIIADAGSPGAVTIATNMAGRGTDIVLGGNLDVELKNNEGASEEKKENIRNSWDKTHGQVIAAGGLHVIGTERHESRRIDNQLRGRSGRQGDPGSSRFYLSLEDDLMRIFASDRVGSLMKKLGMESGEAIEHPWVTRAIENAQRKVEGHNFDIRKQLLEYDDVANDQRRVIYEQRNEMMSSQDMQDLVTAVRTDIVTNIFNEYIPPGSLDEQWDVAGLEEAIENEFLLRMTVQRWLDDDDVLHADTMRDRIEKEITDECTKKEEEVGSEYMRRFESYILLQSLDSHWKEHLAAMDYLRQGISLRSYASKNPKHEYKRESFDMFSQMLDQFKYEAITVLSKVRFKRDDELEPLHPPDTDSDGLTYVHRDPNDSDSNDGDAQDNNPVVGEHRPYVRKNKKLGRNEPCWCGSGKKFKQCHGKLT